MAKVGGENTDLLQISRTSGRGRGVRRCCFSEEDLTRFLQVMLRTFDDLNYRQEQRFHLELGLVKLVHLQRLLPVEELLSGMQGSERSAQSAARRSEIRDQGSETAGSGTRDQGSRAAAPSVPRTSPFEADRNRKITGEAAAGPGAATIPAPRALSPVEAVGRAAAEAKPPAVVGLAEPESAGDGRRAGAGAGGCARSGADSRGGLRGAGARGARDGGRGAASGSVVDAGQCFQGGGAAEEVDAGAHGECRGRSNLPEGGARDGSDAEIDFRARREWRSGGCGAGQARGDAAAGQRAGRGDGESAGAKTQELFQAEIRSVLDLRESKSEGRT